MILSTPNEIPTQGIWLLPENMPTRLSYRPPAATLPTPTLGSEERSSSASALALAAFFEGLGGAAGASDVGASCPAEPSVTTS